MSNRADPDETAHDEPSHLDLIWIYAVYKSLLLPPVAVKELTRTLLDGLFSVVTEEKDREEEVVHKTSKT